MWLLAKEFAERVHSLLPMPPSRSAAVWVLIVSCGSGVEMFIVSDLLVSPGDGSMDCWGLSREGREGTRSLPGL